MCVDSCAGLGLVLTASAPVYDESGDSLIGVVGVDATLEELEVCVSVYGSLLSLPSVQSALPLWSF